MDMGCDNRCEKAEWCNDFVEATVRGDEMGRYTMEYMAKVFLRHAEELNRHREGYIKHFQENHPDTPLEDWMKDDFNMPLAMASILDEIAMLKERLDEIEK